MLELTILMPCLNEAETLETCIRKARGYLEASGIKGEVLIADNGSTDGSQAIAEALGAVVVPVAQRGYGAALIAGIAAARGRFIIMGDSDDSYDFARLDGFVSRLRDGADLVMGTASRAGSPRARCRRCIATWAIRCCRPSAACCTAHLWVTSIAACAAFRGRRS
jgi:glycosyltransferase involved in cell wall biosynthesis